MADTYMKTMVSLNDARVFITTEPAWALVKTDTANAAQYKYFAGASTGESLATMYNNANAGLYSFINRYRYYSNFTGEPNSLVGYKEMCFNIAGRNYAEAGIPVMRKPGISWGLLSRWLFMELILPKQVSPLFSFLREIAL